MSHVPDQARPALRFAVTDSDAASGDAPGAAGSEQPEVLDEFVAELSVLLHRLSRSLHQKSFRSELPPQQVVVLALLKEHQPIGVTELAEKVPCTQPTMTSMLARLEAAGLVDRRSDPRHPRAQAITLSELGERTLIEARTLLRATLTERMVVLNPSEMAALREATPSLSKLLHTFDAERP